MDGIKGAKKESDFHELKISVWLTATKLELLIRKLNFRQLYHFLNLKNYFCVLYYSKFKLISNV
jgi:hypothetical protein